MRSQDKLKLITDRLKTLAQDDRRWERRYLLYCTEIMTGRRVGDLLRLNVGDVRGKTQIMLQEQKTGKAASVMIPRALRQVYDRYLADADDDRPLFCTMRGDRITGKPGRISRMTAWSDTKAIAEIGGITENFGTHSLRKTYGYIHYKNNGDVAQLMKEYNHSSEVVTLMYIGITDELRRKQADGIGDAFTGRIRF